MKKKKGQPMSQWIADVRNAAFHLCAIEVQIDDEDLILILTMGLPPAYKTFVVALDATPAHDLTLDNIISCMLNEESCTIEEEDNILKPNDKALSVTQVIPAARCSHHPVSEITCFKCGKKGHYQINCVNTVPVSHRKEVTNVVIEEEDDYSF